MMLQEGEIIAQTQQAAAMAYAPYSNFKVGCVLVATNGQVFQSIGRAIG